LLFAALGCAKPRFAYHVDEAFRSRAYRSMAPDPRKDRILIREGMRPLNPDLQLQTAMAELEKRRYVRTSTSEADLWVAVYVLMSGQPEGARTGSSHREGGGGGHRGGRGGGGMGGPSESGIPDKALATFTVIVQLEDRKTGLPVWHGEANIHPKDTDADGRPLGIDGALHQLLQSLPTLP
jgi:hypothetical protein